METQSIVIQNRSTKRPLITQKQQDEKSDLNRDLMKDYITILKKRKTSEVKSDDQFDNCGKYLACPLRGMPEKDREYVEFKLLEIIYQVKSYRFINHSFQRASPIFPAFHLQDFQL